MPSPIYTALVETLAPHFEMGKSRLFTLAVLLTGLVNGRTVNLSHIAIQFPGEASHSSNYRRLQRFFQHVQLDQAQVARIVVRMLNLSRPKVLALDRTNWKIGSRDVNILVLAIVTRRFRVPLLWTLLDHQGNSNTEQRIALMKRYLALFDAASIEMLLADREFIGARWMDFLNKNNIPFAIRVKSDMRFVLEPTADNGTGTWSFKSLLRAKRGRTVVHQWSGWLSEGEQHPDLCLTVAAKQLRSREWLIVITNSANAKQALNLYRRRWGIECLFADAKTRGLNMEDTRITNPLKISTMLAIITLAITWAYRCATRKMARKAIKRKSHGRRMKSWFRIGLDTLRSWLANQPDRAQQAWTETCPIRFQAP